MDAYRFTCGAAEHDVELSKFDSGVLANVRRYAPWRTGIFAAVRSDEVARLPHAVALETAGNLARRLEAEQAFLSYDYSIRFRRSGSNQVRTVRSVDLSIGGRRATATAGAGVASVDASALHRIDAEAAEALVAAGKLWPHEAVPFRRWAMDVLTLEVLHDLRDLKPFVSDEGHVLQAVRKPSATNLPAVVGGIVGFLKAHECDEVEVAFLGDPQWG